VYYFTCDCGSKVFFDDLGQPWPIHNCAQYIQSQVEIAIQEKYTRQVKKRRSWQPPIVRCKAEHSQIVEEIGVIREIVKPVDVYSKFDIPKDSRIGSQLLGPLAQGIYVQVTVHVESLDQEIYESYTFLIRREDWNRVGPIRGDLVSFRLKGQPVLTRDSVWLCEELESLW
jgi:hypothetical protein